ncbi:hypothetical protein FACS1894120_2320 [Clostridia bacterium]|nr:hypothetical protein FACS1894120_2320 [Clostridia bacterium]
MDVISTRTASNAVAEPLLPTFDNPVKVSRRKIPAALYVAVQFGVAALLVLAAYLFKLFYPDMYDYVITFVKAKFYVW